MMFYMKRVREPDLNQVIYDALGNYITDVANNTFPVPEHCYGMDPVVLEGNIKY